MEQHLEQHLHMAYDQGGESQRSGAGRDVKVD